MHICANIHTHAPTHPNPPPPHTHTLPCMWVRRFDVPGYLYKFICMHCTHTHTYHTYTHTYTHTHIHTRAPTNTHIQKKTHTHTHVYTHKFSKVLELLCKLTTALTLDKYLQGGGGESQVEILKSQFTAEFTQYNAYNTDF